MEINPPCDKLAVDGLATDHPPLVSFLAGVLACCLLYTSSLFWRVAPHSPITWLAEFLTPFPILVFFSSATAKPMLRAAATGLIGVGFTHFLHPFPASFLLEAAILKIFPIILAFLFFLNRAFRGIGTIVTGTTLFLLALFLLTWNTRYLLVSPSENLTNEENRKKGYHEFINRFKQKSEELLNRQELEPEEKKREAARVILAERLLNEFFGWVELLIPATMQFLVIFFQVLTTFLLIPTFHRLFFGFRPPMDSLYHLQVPWFTIWPFIAGLIMTSFTLPLPLEWQPDARFIGVNLLAITGFLFAAQGIAVIYYWSWMAFPNPLLARFTLVILLLLITRFGLLPYIFTSFFILGLMEVWWPLRPGLGPIELSGYQFHRIMEQIEGGTPIPGTQMVPPEAEKHSSKNDDPNFP